jgi:hypothetical protein
MDLSRLWQLLKKEFTIPKDALRLSLFLSAVLNFVLFFAALHFRQEIRNRDIQSDFIANMATRLMASCDVRHGESRYIKIKIVPFDELVESLHEPIRPTGERYGDLPVWDWRLVESIGDDSWTFPARFADRYNEVVSLQLRLDHRREDVPTRP